MPVITRESIVPYTQEQMFALVNAIEHYREFVPWCVESTVISRTEDEVRATLAFAKSGLQKSFTTLNRLQPHKMMEIRLINGPFKQLEGFWGFEAEGSGCKVKLSLDFEFSNKLVALMFGPLFEQVASKLVDCFTQRANSVYTK